MDRHGPPGPSTIHWYQLYYGTQYFKNSGLKDGFIIQVITSCVNVSSTIPGLYAIDKWGRRPLLLWGAVGMCVSQFIVAMLGTLTTSQDSAGKIIVHNVAAQKAGVAFVCFYIFFFASTWGPIAWVVTGEIFPLHTRAKSLSITTATNVSTLHFSHVLTEPNKQPCITEPRLTPL